MRLVRIMIRLWRHSNMLPTAFFRDEIRWSWFNFHSHSIK
jgi:hypothetical protein